MRVRAPGLPHPAAAFVLSHVDGDLVHAVHEALLVGVRLDGGDSLAVLPTDLPDNALRTETETAWSKPRPGSAVLPSVVVIDCLR